MFRVYISCLAAYTNGKLHGKWIEVSGDEDELRQQIKELLKTSPIEDSEEWVIHGHDGFGSYRMTENPDLEELCDHVTAYSESTHGNDLIDGVIEDLGCGAREAIAYIDDNYSGHYDNVEAWAEEFLEDTGDLSKLPGNLSMYFDYSAYARDCQLNGYIIVISDTNKGVHILHNR